VNRRRVTDSSSDVREDHSNEEREVDAEFKDGHEALR
jgi:hypothetical protein